MILILVVTIISLVKSFIPEPQNELLQHKINEIDKNIADLKSQQKAIDIKIDQYKNEIKSIDSLIQNIRTKRTTINNYYEIKADSIRGYDRKRIITELKKRYKY